MTICNTIEYKLCSEQDKIWAFNEESARMRVTYVEAARRGGEAVLENITVSVKNNRGGISDVSVHIGSYIIRPAHSYKTASVSNGSQFSTVYMIKGSKPDQKTCIYITQEDFNNSTDVIALKSAISSAAEKYRKDQAEDLQRRLALRVPEAAAKARIELPTVARNYGVQGVFVWFTANGFDMQSIKESDLATFTEIIAASGDLVSEVQIESRQTVRGTITKVRCIDFTLKRFCVTTLFSGD